jgi:hypothetical protein
MSVCDRGLPDDRKNLSSDTDVVDLENLSRDTATIFHKARRR